MKSRCAGSIAPLIRPMMVAVKQAPVAALTTFEVSLGEFSSGIPARTGAHKQVFCGKASRTRGAKTPENPDASAAPAIERVVQTRYKVTEVPDQDPLLKHGVEQGITKCSLTPHHRPTFVLNRIISARSTEPQRRGWSILGGCITPLNWSVGVGRQPPRGSPGKEGSWMTD